MRSHPLFCQLLLISCITLGVVLFNRFALPVLFPFLLAYLIVRLLQPGIRFLTKRLHFPNWLAYGVLLLLCSVVLGIVILGIGHTILCQLKLLATNLSIYFQLYKEMFTNCCDTVCHSLDRYLGMDRGSCLAFFQQQLCKIQPDSSIKLYRNVCTLFLQGMSNVLHFALVFLIMLISTLLLCKDYKPLHRLIHKNRFYPVFSHIGHSLLDTGVAYFRSQLLIIICVWIICSLALFLINNPYFVVLGLLISVFDAFPVLGSGMILVPWGIYYLLPFDLAGNNGYFYAAVLFTAYLLCVFLREFLEAKLLAGHINVLPIFTLASIYIGTKLYGISGIFLGPISLSLILTLYRVWMRQPNKLPPK